MFKAIIIFIAGILTGCAVAYFIFHQSNKQDTAVTVHNNDSVAAPLKFPIKATLYRFEMNKGKQQEFNDWMQWHHDEYAAIIETLEREKMYSEAIFTDSVNQPGVLYWLTIDGEGGANVDTSPLKVDSVRNAYMKATIRKGSRSKLTTEFYLIPDFLKQSIAVHQLNEK